MEDERRINIVKVLLKLIVVVLVILFSAWIVTKICSNNNPINSDKLVDQVFQDNLNRMKEVGISYFTLERMPKNVGDKEKITLQDMYDKNLILEVRDEENNLCSDTDSYIEVEKYTWDLYKYEYNKDKDIIESVLVGSFTQYPFKLAWAITIHKSQGKTFNNIILDLGSGAFASGQVYVALSRCTRLKGITLKQRINKSDIILNSRINNFSRSLNSEQ